MNEYRVHSHPCGVALANRWSDLLPGRLEDIVCSAFSTKKDAVMPISDDESYA